MKKLWDNPQYNWTVTRWVDVGNNTLAPMDWSQAKKKGLDVSNWFKYNELSDEEYRRLAAISL